MDTQTWLKRVENVLKEEGFEHTYLQVWKEGQVFGLIKRIDDKWEMHVRGFEDGHLEAEIEISREYLEHLDDRYRRSAVRELSKILSKYNIPHKVTGDYGLEATFLPEPESLTPWVPLIALLTVLGALLWVSSES